MSSVLQHTGSKWLQGSAFMQTRPKRDQRAELRLPIYIESIAGTRNFPHFRLAVESISAAFTVSCEVRRGGTVEYSPFWSSMIAPSAIISSSQLRPALSTLFKPTASTTIALLATLDRAVRQHPERSRRSLCESVPSN